MQGVLVFALLVPLIDIEGARDRMWDSNGRSEGKDDAAP